MKYLILILTTVFSFVANESQSQTSFSQTAFNPTGAILNTSSDTMSITLTRSYSQLSIQPVITKATGTMAGTAVLYSSVNGTNWVSTGDTLTFTNVTTNTTVWTKTSSARYWRIIQSGGTTVTGTASAKVSVTQ